MLIINRTGSYNWGSRISLQGTYRVIWKMKLKDDVSTTIHKVEHLMEVAPYEIRHNHQKCDEVGTFVAQKNSDVIPQVFRNGSV